MKRFSTIGAVVRALAPGILAVAAVAPFQGEQSSHPWLDQQLSKQRYACPAGKSPVRGPADAAVTIVEFADFECPYCRSNEAVVRKVLAAYPRQVRLVFKNHPLDIHSNAKRDALIAECMGVQGKFWEAHDGLLAGVPLNQVTAQVDQRKLKACISQGGEGQLDADLALAKRLGLATTPSYVIDGIRIGGTIEFAQFKRLINAELARKSGNQKSAAR
jgi:protein-disulfide isomerase